MPGASQPAAATLLALQATIAGTVSRLRTTAVPAIRALAFWNAAVLPLAYLPFLAGFDVAHHAGLFLALVAVHGCSLLLGHEYTPAASA